MDKYFILLCTVLLISVNGFSQDLIDVEEANLSTSRLVQSDQFPDEGTYQIMVGSESVGANISDAIMHQINHKRKVDEIVYIIVNEDVKIKILSFNTIRAKNFKPLSKYSYEN